MADYNRQATKQSFDRDGYTVIRAFFSTEEIDEIHGEIARCRIDSGSGVRVFGGVSRG